MASAQNCSEFGVVLEVATNQSPEDRRAHLAFIQAVVTRMSAASTTTKGWLLPIVMATYGYALTQKADGVALLGIAAVLLFGLIDANYLNQERSFRALYDKVADGEDVPDFSMNPSLAAPSESAGKTQTPWKSVWSGVSGWFPDISVWVSWAVAPFYGSLVLVGLVIFCLVRS